MNSRKVSTKMRKVMLTVALALAIGSASMTPWSSPADQASHSARSTQSNQDFGPRYDDEGHLLRPVGWQRWVLAGSSLGLGYTPRTRGESPGTFKHVYIHPTAFDHYVKTGEFPDKTMLVMGVYSSNDRAEPAENGWYPDVLRALEAAVKDEERFEGNWAYFDLPVDEKSVGTVAFPGARCAACHAEHAAVDNVFVQFYPVLRDARAEFQKSR